MGVFVKLNVLVLSEAKTCRPLITMHLGFMFCGTKTNQPHKAYYKIIKACLGDIVHHTAAMVSLDSFRFKFNYISSKR